MRLRLSLFLCLATACSNASRDELAAARTKLAALEQEVARLSEVTASLKAAPPPAPPPSEPRLQLDTPFTATCPAGWRELGAIGSSKWSCRSPQQDKDGSWPQCHIVTIRYDGNWQPREYFDLALSLTPQLRATKDPTVEPIVVENHPGFIATYERSAATTAQKTVASILVEGDSAYVTSCGTSAALFADLEPTFRRVIESVRFGKRP